jgi:Ca2+-binding EF-hand superfamily protein
VRWDVTNRGLVSYYGFSQSILPLKLRVDKKSLDAVFQQYQKGQTGYMDTQAFFESLYGQNSRTQSKPQVSKDHPTVQQAFKDFRAAVARRGGLNGMRSLGRAFRIYDSNGDGTLSPAELKAGLQNFGLSLPATTLTMVIDAADKSRDGKIEYGEFIRTLRGGMNDKRKALVGMAFNQLDRDGSGIVDMVDMKAAYNPLSHPYVKAGRMTAQQALRDFMLQWDTVERDGKITPNEFVEYYEDLSASVDRDDYFELMIRNAWHISGGKGAAANTSNLRVLVVHTDGTQTVECILNDLGLPDKEPDTLKAALAKQGVTDILRVEIAM